MSKPHQKLNLVAAHPGEQESHTTLKPTCSVHAQFNCLYPRWQHGLLQNQHTLMVHLPRVARRLPRLPWRV